MRVAPSLTQRGEDAEPSGAQPEPIARTDGLGDLEHRFAGHEVVEVERELVVGAQLGIQVGEAGHLQRRELRRGGPVNAATAQAGTDDRVVHEDHLAVDGEARVRFEALGPQLQRPAKRPQGVLRFLGACAPVRERDRRHGRSARAPGRDGARVTLEGLRSSWVRRMRAPSLDLRSAPLRRPAHPSTAPLHLLVSQRGQRSDDTWFEQLVALVRRTTPE